MSGIVGVGVIISEFFAEGSPMSVDTLLDLFPSSFVGRQGDQILNVIFRCLMAHSSFLFSRDFANIEYIVSFGELELKQCYCAVAPSYYTDEQMRVGWGLARFASFPQRLE